MARTGNVWHLKMAGSTTEETFGTLGAAMRCAYLLADGFKNWQTDSDAGAVGGV